ncbi:MAG: prolyl oligopeptidase family serine peptidase [Planctomycetes bacterium]|nr:prolyl oligopeptidase family serine peptidase [Planctomycetota bacterium]
MSRSSFPITALMAMFAAGPLFAQPAPPEDAARFRHEIETLRERLRELQKARRDAADADNRRFDERPYADVELYAKAAEWILRHEEFYTPAYVEQTAVALATGLARLEELQRGEPEWLNRPGTTIRGYVSKIDGSVQSYAITLPAGMNPNAARRWPVTVELHGRSNQMNEVNFIHRHDGRDAPEGLDHVRLDVYGRGNNAYRWAGESDVFEALDDVRRRFRIDDKRITLWGFSMGGAGAWHLGLHHPSQWSSVGAGAGFVDFYKYQNQAEKLPDYQHQALHIYDAVDYALNAFNVPVITYGGELDKQLVASTTMVEAAGERGIEIPLIVGKGQGHRFDPESREKFMAFHRQHSEKGRAAYPGAKEIRFITFTPKYNRCEWLTVEEMIRQYEPATVEAKLDDDEGILRVKTENVAVLQIARDVKGFVDIDGDLLPLGGAAGGLLPGVYYERAANRWSDLTYQASRRFAENPNLRKRHDLQGPIDDAFMQPFVCVRGSGEPWSKEHAAWADWTLERFSREFDKWLRGRPPVVEDRELTEELIASSNLVLFGDPGSNSVMAKVLDRLPVRWDEQGFEVNGQRYDAATHGLSLIYPNPLNPQRYVVINSGHTFHAQDFEASNAWLFARLGDIAVQKVTRTDDGYEEQVQWAALFDMNWRLPDR